jgi:HSP20 family protein
MAAFFRYSEPVDKTAYIRIQASGWQVSNRTYFWSPPTDIFETESKLTIRIEIAGMKQSDISIYQENNCLVVSGNRKESNERRAYHQMEVRVGEFNSTIELPKGVDLENAEADYEDGFLTISIPIKKSITFRIKG